MRITIFNKDNTKQVVNMTDAVKKDEKGNLLTAPKLKEKLNTIARSISGQNYLNHKIN